MIAYCRWSFGNALRRNGQGIDAGVGGRLLADDGEDRLGAERVGHGAHVAGEPDVAIDLVLGREGAALLGGVQVGPYGGLAGPAGGILGLVRNEAAVDQDRAAVRRREWRDDAVARALLFLADEDVQLARPIVPSSATG